ncbi:MAG: magnesium transporter [Paracoccus denitrificans]|nr:MAG: magnesium transporter [Paracoccus denitrificans]PZO82929.1 MAG: magnesium transporter [Paracoccus denitrificans]
MLYAYHCSEGALRPVGAGQPLSDADWIDLYRPDTGEIAAVEALGVPVPTLADMEEIEISNRLYREGALTYMTAVLPGIMPEGQTASMPVTFILSQNRLVTVRHHAPRPFETYPARAERSAVPAHSPNQVMLGLVDEMVARLADLSEAAGRGLDDVSALVFTHASKTRSDMLEKALQRIGHEAESMSRVRLALLSLERLLAFYGVGLDAQHTNDNVRPVIKGLQRDIQALEVHAEFLSGRGSMLLDATLGMINLQQNDTSRILSVVAALFLPPTLIASVYGMNFENMPEVHSRWGYVWALGLMVGTSLGTYLLLRIKRWL